MGVVGQVHEPTASTPGKDPIPIVQEAGWASGPVCTGGKSRRHRDSIPDRPARSQSLYRLSYPALIESNKRRGPLGHNTGMLLEELMETIKSLSFDVRFSC